MNYAEVAVHQNKGTGTADIEAAQESPTQHIEDAVTSPTMTQHTSHTTSPPHTTAHHATTLQTMVDHTHNHPANCPHIACTKEDQTL